MPEDDKHEPTERDARVHVAEQFVALPELDVNEAVEEDIA